MHCREEAERSLMLPTHTQSAEIKRFISKLLRLSGRNRAPPAHSQEMLRDCSAGLLLRHLQSFPPAGPSSVAGAVSAALSAER